MTTRRTIRAATWAGDMPVSAPCGAWEREASVPPAPSATGATFPRSVGIDRESALVIALRTPPISELRKWQMHPLNSSILSEKKETWLLIRRSDPEAAGRDEGENDMAKGQRIGGRTRNVAAKRKRSGR